MQIAMNFASLEHFHLKYCFAMIMVKLNIAVYLTLRYIFMIYKKICLTGDRVLWYPCLSVKRKKSIHSHLESSRFAAPGMIKIV